MRSKIFFLTLVAASLAAFTANAATVTLDMIVDGAGGWELYASADDDNAGISGYNIPLLDVLTVNHASPFAALHNTNFNPIGFSELRTPDGATTLFATQKVPPISPTTLNVVYGFGQTPGDFTAQTFVAQPFENTAYSVPLLLATGTYSLNPANPRVDFDSVNLAINLFVSNTGVDTREAEVIPGGGVPVIPEPSSIALMGLALVGLFGMRRRS